MQGRARCASFLSQVVLIATASVVPETSHAQTAGSPDCPGEECVSPDYPFRQGISLVGSLANPSTLSLTGDYYFAGRRASAFVGLGYIPDGWRDHGVSGPTAAVGVRIYKGDSPRNRSFLQLGFSEVSPERQIAGPDKEPAELEGEVFYGPTLDAGLRFVSRGGFTAIITAGLGVGLPDGFLSYRISYGAGYTWP